MGGHPICFAANIGIGIGGHIPANRTLAPQRSILTSVRNRRLGFYQPDVLENHGEDGARQSVTNRNAEPIATRARETRWGSAGMIALNGAKNDDFEDA